MSGRSPEGGIGLDFGAGLIAMIIIGSVRRFSVYPGLLLNTRSISLHFSEFCCISRHFSKFLCTFLHFSALLCIYLNLSEGRRLG